MKELRPSRACGAHPQRFGRAHQEQVERGKYNPFCECTGLLECVLIYDEFREIKGFISTIQ
jgi:hypothetical protein